jgi:hypothetical protein
MISWPMQKRILQVLVLVSGVYIMFPQLELLKTVFTYPILEFISPGFIAGALITYYAAMSLRDRM